MLAHKYRFQVLNSCGQTLAANAVKVTARKKKFTDGALVYAAESTDFDNAGTIVDGAYDEGTAIANTADAMIEGDFTYEVTTPAAADGDVALNYQISTDDGATWPTDGDGQAVATLNMAASETRKTQFTI